MSARLALSQYTSCDVSDALVHFGDNNGGFIPNLIQRSSGNSHKNSRAQSMVGPAYTVLYAPKSDPRPAVSQSYIDEIPKDGVLVIALTEDQQITTSPFVTVNNALYGGLMSARAKYREAAGSIVLGRIRDLAEHRGSDYPVWSYAVGTTAPKPVVKVIGINVSLTVKVASTDGTGFRKLFINPGDYMVADENGVVRIPMDQGSGADSEADLEEILEYLPKRVYADERVCEDIKKGRAAAEAQKFWRDKI